MLFLIQLLFIPVIYCHKILVFSPTNSVSHLLANQRIGDTLALDGHDVTILEAEFRVKTRPAKIAKKIVLSGFDPAIFDEGQASLTAETFSDDNFLNHLTYDSSFFDAFNHQCDVMLSKHKEVLSQLSKANFDVIFAEQLNLCGVGLQKVLNIPTLVWVSSCPLDDHMSYLLGVPTPLSYVPAVGEISVSDKMSFIERLRNIVEYYRNVRSYFYGMVKTDEIFKKHYGPDFPSVIDLARDSDLTFVLADEFLDFPRPILHNTVYIGGLGLTSATSHNTNYLDELIQEVVDGVVLFSLGTNIETKTVAETFKVNLFKAFAEFPHYKFIVKMDSDDEVAFKISQHYKNVKIVDWVDQPALLSDPRLKLFITHGGYNSLLESVNHAKVLLLMPLFGDQWRNAQLAERNGFGKIFEKKSLLNASTVLARTLKEMFETDRYEKAVKRMQNLIKSKPLNATERLLKYTRFLLDNGGKLPELQIEGRKLSAITYYNLDVLALIITIFTLPFWIIFLCLRRMRQKKLKKD
uniref:Glucuronosyltransferase n=1 Tax=Panagrolaimus sp. JU765 TaxID=591449 RepID=A0AC34PUN0_9BILA